MYVNVNPAAFRTLRWLPQARTFIAAYEQHEPREGRSRFPQLVNDDELRNTLEAVCPNCIFYSENERCTNTRTCNKADIWLPVKFKGIDIEPLTTYQYGSLTIVPSFKSAPPEPEEAVEPGSLAEFIRSHNRRARRSRDRVSDQPRVIEGFRITYYTDKVESATHSYSRTTHYIPLTSIIPVIPRLDGKLSALVRRRKI